MKVRVRKISACEAPHYMPGDPATWNYGGKNDNNSLPVGYELEGEATTFPSVGNQWSVIRHSRNGIVVPGLFVSTAVTKAQQSGSGGTFTTSNSIYQWTVISEQRQA